MNKPTIAIDIDDVLVPHVEDLIAWHNKEYGTHMSLEQYHSRNPKDWGAATIEEAIKRVQRFFVTPHFLEAKPIHQAYDALKKLGRRFNLVIITSRDNIIEDVTRQWLDRHFPELFQEVHFTARFNLEGAAKPKSGVALTTKADYLIDDALDNMHDAAEAGVKVLLFGDYPWNKIAELPPEVTRVNNWPEVLEFFDEKG